MSILSAEGQKQLEQALIEGGYLTKEKLEQVRQEADKANQPMVSYLVSNNLVTDEQLTKATAQITKLPYVNLQEAKVNPGILALLPREIAERYMAVPLGEMQNRLVVAMLDADNVQAVDYLSNRIGRPLKVYLASETGIRQVLKQYSSRLDLDSGMGKVLSEQFGETTPQLTAVKGKHSKDKDMENLVEDSPISKAVTEILNFAARNRASDVHIEPADQSLNVRLRIDGIMKEIMRLPKNAEPAFISRIKILSNLKIDEHRVPQDGGFNIRVDGRDIDLRVAVAPVVWGEEVVIRLLDKTSTSFKLEDLGYTGRALRMIRKSLKRPSGMILTSGPTGSGKSTSMYALIQEIKNEAINIVTLEDPVEYKMSGVNQIQVNPDVGLTFAAGLRSILRQDPNVVLVGEIRDKETAELAIQASLTGHLVFSTLHTNNAAGILPRLLDMGVEPFLIASTVNIVIGQRLVRRLAGNKQSYQSTEAETVAIKKELKNILPQSKELVEEAAKDIGYKNLPLLSQNAYTLYRGVNTPDTPDGYKGRMGLYEIFEVTSDIQNLIMQRATSNQIEKVAIEKGSMVNMRQDGYLKALAGMTTLNEVNRVAAETIG